MEFSEYWAVLRRFWVLIIVLTVLGAGSAYAISRIVPPRYEVSSTLFVSVETGGDPTAAELQSALSFARKSVASYAQFIATPFVLDGAMGALQGRLSASELEESIVAYARTGTSLIEITVTLHDPQLAYDASSAIVKEATRVISEQQSNRSKALGPVLVDVVTPPRMPVAPSSPQMPLVIALGVFFGLAAGFIVAFAAHAAQRTRRDRIAVG